MLRRKNFTLSARKFPDRNRCEATTPTMKKYLRIVLPVFIVLNAFAGSCYAQFTPPGLGRVNSAMWFAAGVKQDLNAKKTVTSTTYLGLGTTSNPSNFNPFDHKAIYVINEEISHRFANHWQYSGAVSYRWQNMFSPTKPYEEADPSGRQEFRIYTRFSYLTSINKLDLTFTYRPELRFFYNPDFTAYKNKEQFRSRFSGKLNYNISPEHSKKIIFTTELLFATNKEVHWDTWKYNEARFSLYYSFALPSDDVILSFGYMNDLIGIGKRYEIDANYLAIDIAFKNLFSHHEKHHGV